MMTVSEIYTTSPTQGPEKVLESFALLDQLHIPYSRVEHEPAETMEACAAGNAFLDLYDATGDRICYDRALAIAETYSRLQHAAKRPISTC